MANRPQALAELALIRRIQAQMPVRNGSVRVGIGDDCAVLRVPRGHELLVTTDFSLEGRHFRRDWHTPESAGHRCLARGLSDIAAMGGKPLAAFLSLALPRDFEAAWLDRFLAGMGALAERFGVELAGGDTAQAPGEQILTDIMVTGAAPRGRALGRGGVKSGDVLYVTGSLGGAAAELARLAAGVACPTQADAQSPQSFPEPRLAVGQLLLKRGLATACMDVSDGLSSDIWRLAEASGVSFEIHKDAVPVSLGATFLQALTGGEDYELLFTAGAETRVQRLLGGVAVTRIGRALRPGGGRPEIWLLEGEARTPLEPGGWEHFQTVS